EASVADYVHDTTLREWQLRPDRRGQPGSHRRESIVEQHGVRPGRAVVAGEPDLVHAVVQGHDPIGRDHVADLLDDPLWDEPFLIGSLMDLDEDLIAHRQERLGGGYGTAEHLGELVQGRRQVPDDLELREIHLLDDGGTVPDVDDGRPGL